MEATARRLRCLCWEVLACRCFLTAAGFPLAEHDFCQAMVLKSFCGEGQDGE